MFTRPFAIFATFALALSAAAEMHWIWTQNGSSTGEKTEYRHSFTVDGKVTKAELLFTCDNGADAYINGKLAVKNSDWMNPSKKDVKSLLKAGENEIRFDARNAGGIAAIVGKLTITTADKKTQVIETGTHWQGRKKGAAEWGKPVSLGKYGVQPWGKSLDNKPSAAKVRPDAPEGIQALPGFKVERLYDVPKGSQGSWVAMTVDDKGRIIAGDQYGKLYRVTVPPIGSTEGTQVEALNADIDGAHGLYYGFGALYVMKNENKGDHGFYRLRDTNGDDQFDEVKLLRKIGGGGEHGSHSIVPSPDGKSLYLVGGNHANLPDNMEHSRVPMKWSEDHILPRMWDARGHARGRLAPGGWIARTDPDGKEIELLTIGFRNQFDAAFDSNGELFTYDADMEWDLGTPWYRPTRINHCVSGSDHGWRSGSGKWPNYYLDNPPPVLDIGPGCPTGVASGLGAKFPAKYQRAIYVNDWTYGTMYAIHLMPQGASFVAEKEEFVTGRPLPLTDLIVHPDGALYFMIGGRRSTSALLRVVYTGKDKTAPVASLPPTPEAELRVEIEKLHEVGVGTEAIAKAWPHLDHADRFIRYAARVAIERQPVAAWQAKALAETRPWARIEAAVALAHIGDPAVQADLHAALGKIDIASLSRDQLLGLLRAYQLTFTRLGTAGGPPASAIAKRLDALYPHTDNAVNIELCQLLIYLKHPSAVSKTLQLLATAKDDHHAVASEALLARNAGYGRQAHNVHDSRPNLQQFSYLFALRNADTGWSPELRQTYFSWYPRAFSWKGGNSFKGFLENARKEALEKVPDAAERKALEELSNRPVAQPANIVPPEGPGGNWTLDSAQASIENALLSDADFERGKELYTALACASCHRFNGEGGGIGPDITGSGNRYTLRDLLENIITPSAVISDQYGSSTVTRKSGAVIVGRITHEDEKGVHLLTNPFAPDTLAIIPTAEIAKREPLGISMMPPGLINACNEKELLDLIAYLLSGGNPEAKVYDAPPSQSLFDGKSLKGWQGDPSHWSVEDGVIVGSTMENKAKSNTFLIWEGGDVTDFQLTLEAKLEGSNNSGIQYRSKVVDPANYRVFGYQMDMHPNPPFVGMMYGEGTGRGIMATRGQKIEFTADGKKNQIGTTTAPETLNLAEWHTYRITARGNRLIHEVDGKVTIDITDNDPRALKSGVIALQVHGGGPMKVSCRNIQLTKFE
jgi:putative heme-binding domain-containing protein